MPIADQFDPFVLFNVTTPSSAGAACGATFARPPTGNAVFPLAPADTASEILGDVYWIWTMG